MPKRENTIEFYEEQIKKLKEKEKKRKIPKNVQTSVLQNNSGDVGTHVNQPEVAVIEPGLARPIQLERIIINGPSQTTAPPPLPLKKKIQDSELLAVLDEDDDISEENSHPTYGANIHEKLATKWLSILCKGLDRSSKSKLLSEYAFPQNCKWLRAPVLNNETEPLMRGKNRDDKIAARQDQLGKSIAAISKAMTLIILDNDKNLKQAMEALSDGCKLLTDLHYMETQSRIELIKHCVPKDIVPVIENQIRDDYLFGADLREKLKLARGSQSYQQTKSSQRKSLPLNSSRSGYHDFQGSYVPPGSSRDDPGWDYREADRQGYNLSRISPNYYNDSRIPRQ